MAWETRNNQRYYYRARKIDGLVVKEYIGTGSAAERLAEHDRITRQERQERKAATRQHRAALTAIDAPIEAFVTSLESLTRATLIASGYHRHHGSEWRRRRNG